LYWYLIGSRPPRPYSRRAAHTSVPTSGCMRYFAGTP
jgi:hypothetical protein